MWLCALQALAPAPPQAVPDKPSYTNGLGPGPDLGLGLGFPQARLGPWARLGPLDPLDPSGCKGSIPLLGQWELLWLSTFARAPGSLKSLVHQSLIGLFRFTLH